MHCGAFALFHKFIYCKPIQPYCQLTPPSPYIITFSFLWWDYLLSLLAAFCVVVVTQLPSRVWLIGTPWTATHQAPLSSTVSQNLLKFMSIESVMPSTISSFAALFSSCLQSFPASGSFPMSLLFASGDQSIGASATVLSVNIQGWFPLGLSGLISLHPKDSQRVFSSTTNRKHQFKYIIQYY